MNSVLVDRPFFYQFLGYLPLNCFHLYRSGCRINVCGGGGGAYK